MRFNLFAVLSGLAALAIVNALPAENLQRGTPEPDRNVCCQYVSLTFHAQQVTRAHCHERTTEFALATVTASENAARFQRRPCSQSRARGEKNGLLDNNINFF